MLSNANSFDSKKNPYNLIHHRTSIVDLKEQELAEKGLTTTQQSNDNLLSPHERLYKKYARSSNYGIVKKFDSEARAIAFEGALGSDDLRESYNKHNLLGSHGYKSSSGKISLPELRNTQNPKDMFKAKKETVKNFVSRKREIFLANMMIQMKKEETNKLKEFIVSEEETLNEHEADFREDKKFSDKWIADLKNRAEEAHKKAEDEAEKKAKLTRERDHIYENIRLVEKNMEKDSEVLEALKEYKVFFEELCQSKMYPVLLSERPDKGNKKAQTAESAAENDEVKSKIFLTAETTAKPLKPESSRSVHIESEQIIIEEEEDLLSKFEKPEQLLRLLELIEEENHFAIQNAQEAQDEFEKVKKAKEEELKKVEEKCKASHDRKLELEKKINIEKEKNKILVNRKLMADNKTDVKLDDSDSGVLKIDAIKNKISEIFGQINGVKNVNEELAQNSDQIEDLLIDYLKKIEKTLEELIKYYITTYKSEDNIKAVLIESEKSLENRKKLANAEKKRQAIIEKREEERKKKEKKNQNIKKKIGRPDVFRSSFHEKEEITNSYEDDNVNDDEKYLKEDFHFSIIDTKPVNEKTQSLNNKVKSKTQLGKN